MTTIMTRRRGLAALTLALTLLATCLPVAALEGASVPAPALALPAVANAEGTLDLAALRGQVVYVDFWASWCGPCRLSLPALDGLYKELSDEGFNVLAVSVDVVEEDALDFLKRYVVSYPVAIDTEGATPDLWSVNGMPSGYLVDRKGQVREVHVGFKRGDEVALKATIQALLAENP